MNKEEKKELKQKQKLRSQFQTAGVVIFTGFVLIALYFAFLRSEELGETLSTIGAAFTPVVSGLIMAFLVSPMMGYLEKWFTLLANKITKKDKSYRKGARSAASIISVLTLIAIIVLFFVVVVPEIISTLQFLSGHIGEQVDNFVIWVNEITDYSYEEVINNLQTGQIDEYVDQVYDWGVTNYESVKEVVSPTDIVSKVTVGVIGVGKFLFNIFVGIFVAIYALMAKDTFRGQAKKIIYGIFKPAHANVVLEVSRKTSELFHGFISGKIFDSFIIGVLCYIAMVIMKLPYALLVSLIVGVTNIVPVFGPYIGAIPSFIIIVLTEPVLGLYFIIMIVVLQQIDGNIIGPKILGDSTGLSSFWVVFAIVVGGSLFGFLGMLLGVPTVAVIYYICGRTSRWLLKKRGMDEETTSYVNLESVDAESLEIITKTVEEKEASKPKAGFSKVVSSVVNKIKIQLKKISDTKKITK